MAVGFCEGNEVHVGVVPATWLLLRNPLSWLFFKPTFEGQLQPDTVLGSPQKQSQFPRQGLHHRGEIRQS